MLGIYTIAVSIYIVFATALNSGLPVTISKLTAEKLVEKNNNKLNSLVTSGLVISVIMSVFMLAVIILSRYFLNLSLQNKTVYMLLITMLPAILFTGIYAPIRGFLWGKESYFKVSLVEFIEQIIRILSCAILFMFLAKSTNVFAATISLSIACVLSTLLGIYFYFTSKGKFTLKEQYYKPILKSSTPITLVRFVGSLMQPLLAVLIPIQLVRVGFTSEQALSQLGIAMGMTMPLLMIPGTIIGSLAMALIPKISALVKESKDIELKKQVNSAVVFTLCCSFLIIPIFISVGGDLCIIIFNNATAGEYLKHASWLVVALCLSQLSSSILNSLGLEVKTFKYYVISAVFVLISIYTLPQYFGIYSLLYGLGISGIVVCILSIRKINKTIHNKNYYLKPLLVLVAICIPTTILLNSTHSLLTLFLPMYLSVLITAGLGFVCFILLLLVTGMISTTYIKTNLKHIKIARAKTRT